MTNVTLIESILIEYKPHVVTLSDKQTSPLQSTCIYYISMAHYKRYFSINLLAPYEKKKPGKNYKNGQYR